MRYILPTTLAVIALATAGWSEPDNSTPKHHVVKVQAVRINVIDMNQALGFYTGLLEFDISSRSDYPRTVTLQNEGADIILVACDSQTDWEYDLGSRFNLNLYVENLPSYIERYRQAGVRFLDDTLRTAGVGRYTRFLDPSGNQLHLMELNYDHPPVSRPTVYNLGLRVTDMATARRFYEELFGFEVLSEAYYPPVIPYKLRGIQLILHEGGVIRTTPDYPSGTQTILALATDNIAAIADSLTRAGHTVQACQTTESDGAPCLVVRDPDGNVVEVREYRPTSP